MRAWLASYDLNLTLLDVINDPEASDVAVRLAALSLAEGLDGGYYDAEALSDAVAHLWAEAAFGISDDRSEARVGLADLLARSGSYTRALYDEVKSLSARGAALHLYDHAKRMMDRADMARIVRESLSPVA